ncbi:putative mitochondrial protein [Tanacetum coccineum]
MLAAKGYLPSLTHKIRLDIPEIVEPRLEVNTTRYWLMLLGLRSTAGMVVLELILLGLVNTAKLSLVNTASVIQFKLLAIQDTLANIQAEGRTHTTKIANLKREEETSQPRTGVNSSLRLMEWQYPNNTPWEHFEVEVVKRFGVLYDDPIVELKNLKQTGLVQTYQEAFEVLLNRVDLPELVVVSMFMGGLKPEVGTPMRMFQATALSESYGCNRPPILSSSQYKAPRVTDSPQITLNALSGLNSYQTMRVKGRVGKKVVYILIDYGSTHNFLDVHTAKKLGCRLAKTTPMQVSVANGQRMMSTYVCHYLKWSLQNEVFTSDVMLLPLGGCEMVLGIQWLATLGDMQCNFKKLIMKFNHKGRQLVLRGMNNTHVHWMQGNERMLKQAELSFMALCVYPVQLCQMESVGSVFAEVEQELMDSGVIRASQSPFLSPIVMVKKKDGTWKMCTDYRQLNKHTVKGHKCSGQLYSIEVICEVDFDNYIDGDDETYEDCVGDMGNEGMLKQAELSSMAFCVYPVQLCQMESVGSVSAEVEQVLTQFDEVLKYQKTCLLRDHMTTKSLLWPKHSSRNHTVKDKFPIPVIEEVNDEWNGSVVFSKLDLRSRYHQIQIKEDDICKTAFRTHEGHYEFLVMPFGLKNAPLTFQIMKDNTLYAKKSKCYFAVPQVEYLGHIISDQGVSTDPSKIEAMQKWPISLTLKQLRGFLGLTGYYRRFIKDYLKEAMVKAPVLALPNFDQEFVVETDASGKGVGAWLPKLLGYDYEIVYKKGNKNVVADALSRIDSSGELLQISVSSVSSGVWDKVKDSWKNDLDTQNLIKSLEHHSYKGNKYSWTGEILKRKGKVKPDLSAYPGLIQPLPIPERIWKEISMDFIEKLPTSHGKSVILVLHGLPESIMSDKDKVFLSNFWKALFAKLKVKLKLSTVYHPQTDGQTKVVNRSLGCYLRCMCDEKPKE